MSEKFQVHKCNENPLKIANLEMKKRKDLIHELGGLYGCSGRLSGESVWYVQKLRRNERFQRDTKDRVIVCCE